MNRLTDPALNARMTPPPGTSGTLPLLDGLAYRVRVTYPEQLGDRRVERVQLELELLDPSRPPSSPPTAGIVVQPTVPGCVVTPPQAVLDPTVNRGKAVLCLTPLAVGPLPGAQLDFLKPPHALHTLPLPMRVVSPRQTQWLLAAAVVVPALLAWLASAADRWPVAVAAHLPGGAATERVLTAAATALADAESRFHVAFVAGVALGLAAATAAWRSRRTRRMVYSQAFLLNVTPPPQPTHSGRMPRPALPLLSPVVEDDVPMLR